MNINWQEAANISQTIGIILAIVALIITFLQLRANSRQKAAEFIIGLNNTIFQHRHMSEIYYKIEKNQLDYEGQFNLDDEIAVASLLDHFEGIAKLYLLSNFTLKDLGYLAYYYLVVYQNEAVREYIADFNKLYKKKGMTRKAYADFIKVGNLLERSYCMKCKCAEDS